MFTVQCKMFGIKFVKMQDILPPLSLSQEFADYI